MEPISEALKQFIFTYIETVDQLRILLLLHAGPTRAWSSMSVATRLYLQLDVAQKGLDMLRQKGLLAVSDTSEGQYRYQPISADLAQMVRKVVELDRTRPVTLIRLIYSRLKDAPPSSSGAFKVHGNS
jgi:hypothetical protein